MRDSDDQPSDAVVIWRMRALIVDYLDWAGSFRPQDGPEARWAMIDRIAESLDYRDIVGGAANTGPPQYTFDEVGALARLEATWRRVVSENPPVATIHQRPASAEILCAAWAALDTFSVRGRHPPERPPELEN
jgi:hypothetical protein